MREDSLLLSNLLGISAVTCIFASLRAILTLCHEEAIRGLAMLKAKMSGEKIKAPERNYTHVVKEANVELIEKAYGTKMELVDNEQVLPMSEKRKAKYD